MPPKREPTEPNSDSNSYPNDPPDDDNDAPDLTTGDYVADDPPSIEDRGEDIMAKIDRAIRENEAPTYVSAPSVHGATPDPFAAPTDPGEAQARALSDGDRELLRAGILELLPIAARILYLHMNGKNAQLDAVLTAIGFPENQLPGEEYTEPDPYRPGQERTGVVGPGMVRVHPDRQRVHDALSTVA